MALHPFSPAPRTRSRGFTLVELVVALSAGVLVSTAAFLLSKNATHFFQHEARISAAQLSLTLGMNRLTSDIQRASFLSTPNFAADPNVCRPSTNSSAGLAALAGVRIVNQGLSPPAQSKTNGLFPEQLVLGGSFDSTERFTIQCILGDASAPVLQLQTAAFDNAMARVVSAAMPPAATVDEAISSQLSNVFKTGRFVNIFNPATGYSVYAIIDENGGAGDGKGFSVMNGVVSVLLKATPAIPTRPSSPCGLTQFPMCGAGLLVSVVSRVQYDIRSLASVSGAYSTLVKPVATDQTGDGGRTELVRVELDADGNEISSRLELVSEYAVDLRFGITVSTQILSDNYNPTVSTLAIKATPDQAIQNTTASTPQRVRAVQVRLATRTRAPDRDATLPTGGDGRVLRFLLDTTPPPKQYARVRNAYANVALPNQGGFSLW